MYQTMLQHKFGLSSMFLQWKPSRITLVSAKWSQENIFNDIVVFRNITIINDSCFIRVSINMESSNDFILISHRVLWAYTARLSFGPLTYWLTPRSSANCLFLFCFLIFTIFPGIRVNFLFKDGIRYFFYLLLMIFLDPSRMELRDSYLFHGISLILWSWKC